MEGFEITIIYQSFLWESWHTDYFINSLEDEPRFLTDGCDSVIPFTQVSDCVTILRGFARFRPLFGTQQLDYKS